MKTCAGSNDGSIVVEVSGSYPGFSYEWSNGATSKDIDKLTAGTYALTVIDEKDCSAEETITLIEPEKPTIGDITGPNGVETLQTYSYTVSNQDNYSWHWMADGGTIISGQGTNTVEIQWGSKFTGVVSVFSESASGCLSDTSYLNVSINSTGIGEIEAHGFSIYPVPAKDFLMIEAADLKPYFISLCSVNGAVIFNASFEGTSQVNLSTYPMGVIYADHSIGEFHCHKEDF